MCRAIAEQSSLTLPEPDFAPPLYGPLDEAGTSSLLHSLNALTVHHSNSCANYAKILRALDIRPGEAKTLAELPFLPVELFKNHQLESVPASLVKIRMTSSGTTGMVSKIAVDEETARLQASALAHSMKSILGSTRLPMLICDYPEVIRDPRLLTARGAGVLGMMRFGRDHTFILNEDMSLNVDAFERFVDKYRHQDVLIFGFTFMVWAALVESRYPNHSALSGAKIIHSGGWKKLQDRAVSNSVFRSSIEQSCGARSIFNFYGMVEQMGTIHLEMSPGTLSSPRFGGVIVRDPMTLRPVPDGTPGILQVLSTIPRSYPGHSILTGDLGVIEPSGTNDTEGVRRQFRVLGRVPKAELRGCSDVYPSEIRV